MVWHSRMARPVTIDLTRGLGSNSTCVAIGPLEATRRKVSPSTRKIKVSSAPDSLAALSATASNTGWISVGELATSRPPRGSADTAQTMGIVLPTSFAARSAARDAAPPCVTMTSGLRRTSSMARAGRRSRRPSPYRSGRSGFRRKGPTPFAESR